MTSEYNALCAMPSLASTIFLNRRCRNVALTRAAWRQPSGVQETNLVHASSQNVPLQKKTFTNTTLYTKGVEKAGSPNSTGHTTYVAPNGGGVLIHSKDNALQEEVGEEYRWFPCQNMKHGLV